MSLSTTTEAGSGTLTAPTKTISCVRVNNSLLETRLPYNTVLMKVESPKEHNYTVKVAGQKSATDNNPILNNKKRKLLATSINNSTLKEKASKSLPTPQNQCTVETTVNNSLLGHSTLQEKEQKTMSSAPEDNSSFKNTSQKSLAAPKNHATLKKTVKSSPATLKTVKKSTHENNSALKMTGKNSQSTSVKQDDVNEQTLPPNKYVSTGTQVDSYTIEIKKLKMKMNMLQKQNSFLKKQNNKQCKQLNSEKLLTQYLKVQANKCSKELAVIEKIKTAAKEKSPMGSYLYDLIHNFNLKRPRWSETSIQNCITWRQKSPWSYIAARKMQIIKTPSKSTLESYMSDKKESTTDSGNKALSKTKKQVISMKKKKQGSIIVIDDGIHITLANTEIDNPAQETPVEEDNIVDSN
jgi:hypothetical protein